MKATYRGGNKPSKRLSGFTVLLMGGTIISGIAALVTQNHFVFIGGFAFTCQLAFLGLFIFYVPNLSQHSGEISIQPGVQKDFSKRLEKLKALREEELITEEEYSLRKSEILDEI